MIDYDPHHWWDHFFDVRGSMVREILSRVAGAVLWTVAVVAFDRFIYPVGIPSTVHTLAGLVLSLLLVFRTNASYDRFWEGRKLWGGIVNDCRNLVRSARQPLAKDPQLHQRLTLWVAQFPFAVIQVLRGKGGLSRSAQRLPPKEVEAVLGSPNVGVAVAEQISQLLGEAQKSGAITDVGYLQLDGFVTRLVDGLGGCERIHKTPLPFAYVVHLRRALILYTIALPFALVDSFGWVTVLDVFFLAYLFFGIEEIGVEIEDPFGVDENDLPLESISQGIEKVTSSMSLAEA